MSSLTVDDIGANLSFDETFATITLHPSSGCTGGGAAAATCPDAGITRLVFDLGEGDDGLTTQNSVTLPVQADGGAGDDTLNGGAGSDGLDGDVGTDTLDGGNGPDTVHGGEGADLVAGGNGSDQLFGDGGNDVFGGEGGNDDVSGGTGVDAYYTYGSWPTPVPYSLNDVADDGVVPDIANVRTDVEELRGDLSQNTADMDLRLTGGPQANGLHGGNGDDVIDGLGGSDVLSGGDGDDQIKARDGAVDRVACGPGTDSASVDFADVVDECENVDRAAAPAAATPQAAPAAEDAAPRVAFLAPAGDALLDPRRANAIVVDASDDRGVEQVVLFDDGHPVGIDATAPYTFAYVPGGDDVGRNTLVAVAYDAAGQTASDIHALRLSRFAARSLSAAVTPGRDTRAPYRFTTSGRLNLPAGVTRAQGCAEGEVAITVKRGRRTMSTRRATLRRDCTFRSTISFRSRPGLGGGRLRVAARFLGNDVLRPVSAPTRTARAGRR